MDATPRSPIPTSPASRWLLIAGIAACLAPAACRSGSQPPADQHLRVALRAEPRTFNPVIAIDAASTSVSALLHAELFRIDATTLDAAPELAEGLERAADQRTVTVKLRRGVRFPDGEPFGADDVVFSLEVFQDPAVGSPQLQALRVGDRATLATALDDHTVRFEFGLPHPEPGRLLAGLPMLPRHVLEPAYRAGKLAEAWALDVDPATVIGLGPFRLAEYRPGQHVALRRNEAFWKKDASGRALPYLDRVTALVISDPDAAVARLLSGDLDLLSAFDTRAYQTIAAGAGARGLEVHDRGPSLEYAFLLFNLDDAGAGREAGRRARRFHDASFRRAVSVAIDRREIARLVYDDRATPLASHVSPGNVIWHAGLAPERRSLEEARRRLREAGYRWDPSGRLLDARGEAVSFSVLTSTSNAQRQRIASVIQADLLELGIDVRVVALEFRAMVERVTKSRDFDAAIMALGGSDPDPNSELNVWEIGGTTHLWRMSAKSPLAPWEQEIDVLMRQQATTLDRERRRQLYGKVQQLVAENLPIVPLVSPNHLVAARHDLLGLRPGVGSRDSLWNIEELSRTGGVAAGR